MKLEARVEKESEIGIFMFHSNPFPMVLFVHGKKNKILSYKTHNCALGGKLVGVGVMGQNGNRRSSWSY